LLAVRPRPGDAGLDELQPGAAAAQLLADLGVEDLDGARVDVVVDHLADAPSVLLDEPGAAVGRLALLDHQIAHADILTYSASTSRLSFQRSRCGAPLPRAITRSRPLTTASSSSPVSS